MQELKLNFELVPDGCWYSNLRSILKPSDWDKIRKIAYAEANGKCMICGAKTSHLEAHEQWSYDEKNCIQKLERVVAVCHKCHEVIHIGRTQLMGNDEEAENHFMKVNNCSYVEMRAFLKKANEDHKRRNLVSEWKIDLTYLKRYLNNI